jgi:26S proteasome regulatory subunit N6
MLKGQPDDIAPLLLLKSAAPHAGSELDSMRATAKALKERSLDMFKTALKDYQERELAC